MTKSVLAIVTALAMVPFSVNAATIVIDDFDSGVQVVTAFAPGMSNVTNSAPGTMLGGERDITVQITSSSGASTVTAALGGGSFDIGNGPPPSSAIVVANWDGSGSGFTPTDFTFGGMGGDVLIDVVSVDDNGTPILGAITLLDLAGNTAMVTTGISTVGLVTIPLSAFVGVDLTTIVGVEGALVLGPDDDLSLGFIGVEMRPIPEASTVIVWSSILALGCCGAWIKKNRQ